MRWSYKITTIFGIPVRVHISLLVFLGLVALFGGGVYGLILMSAVFGSVVVHELGHALVARSKGLPIADISLYPFGGMARMMAAPRTTKDEILVAAAGPVVSFILGLVFWAMAVATNSAELWLLSQVNLLLGGFNLLPALPMDGGRIFRAVVARRVGFYRATRAAVRLARWIALAMLVAGFIYSTWLVVIALFLLFASTSEEVMARARQYMGDPGYHDAPGTHGLPYDPVDHQKPHTRVPGTDWEVLVDDHPRPRPGRRVYTDRNGNRVVIEWWKT